MEIVKKWVLQWVKSSSCVEALVAFGSVGRQENATSSDLDLCVLTSDMEIARKLQVDLRATFPRGIIYLDIDGSKICCFLTHVGPSNDVARIDCFIVDKLISVQKYIIGSELSVESLDSILLYKREDSDCERLLTDIISSNVPIPNLFEFTEALIKKFAEYFEAACNKRCQGDKSLFLFNIFLAYLNLCKLEYIRRGGRKFLYQPKMIFPFFDLERD